MTSETGIRKPKNSNSKEMQRGCLAILRLQCNAAVVEQA